MAKAQTEVKTVTMTDGRVVEFPGKRKMQKAVKIDADGFLEGTFDFANGETRNFILAPGKPLVNDFAIHGIKQKFGDEIAGLEEVDDCVEAIDDLILRLNKGEWSEKREGGAMAGASILAKALVEWSGQSLEAIRAFLSTKTNAEKLALRNDPEVAGIVARLEAEKAAKAPKIDTASILSGLLNPVDPAVGTEETDEDEDESETA